MFKNPRNIEQKHKILNEDPVFPSFEGTQAAFKRGGTQPESIQRTKSLISSKLEDPFFHRKRYKESRYLGPEIRKWRKHD